MNLSLEIVKQHKKTLCLNLIKTKNKLSAGTSFGCTTQQAKL